MGRTFCGNEKKAREGEQKSNPSWAQLSVAIKRKLGKAGNANGSVLAHHIVLNFFWSRFQVWRVNHAVARVHVFCTRIAVEGVELGLPSM